MEIRTYPISFSNTPNFKQKQNQKKKEKESKKEENKKFSDIFEKKMKEDKLL